MQTVRTIPAYVGRVNQPMHLAFNVKKNTEHIKIETKDIGTIHIRKQRISSQIISGTKDIGTKHIGKKTTFVVVV